MKRILLLSLLASIALVGCQSPSSDSSTTPEPNSTASTGGDALKKMPRVAVIPKGTTHEFWKAVHAGAEAAGKEFSVEVIWKGPLKEDDLEDQIKVVEDFTTQKVDGLVVAPLSDTGMRTSISAAITEGIPVVIFDSGLKDVETSSFVATDNKVAGGMGGKKLIESMGEGAKKVIVLRYQEGSASTNERETGAIEALKANTNITILSDNQYGGATTESAQKASENLLNRFKGANGEPGFDGVFCPNESSTFGMLRALQDAGWAGKVKFVGFDSSEKLMEALKKNEINGLVLQNPYKIGYEAVKAMAMKIRGEAVEARIDTGAVIVDSANLETDEIKKVLNPAAK